MDINNYLKEICNEAYTSTITKRGRAQKIKTTAGAIGVSLARKKDDPLYKKMIYYTSYEQKAGGFNHPDECSFKKF